MEKEILMDIKEYISLFKTTKKDVESLQFILKKMFEETKEISNFLYGSTQISDINLMKIFHIQNDKWNDFVTEINALSKSGFARKNAFKRMVFVLFDKNEKDWKEVNIQDFPL